MTMTVESDMMCRWTDGEKWSHQTAPIWGEIWGEFFLFFRRLYDIIHTSVIPWWELCMNPLDFGFFIRHTDPLFSLKPEPGPGTS